jgi:hypothetical protein
LGSDYFVRASLDIPIHGSSLRFTWGVWGSLSEKSSTKMTELMKKEGREHEPPYFSWLCTALPRDLYPDTLHLKSHVFEQPVGQRRLLVLEQTDHPLSVEQHEGISLDRARQMARALLGAQR